MSELKEKTCYLKNMRLMDFYISDIVNLKSNGAVTYNEGGRKKRE